MDFRVAPEIEAAMQAKVARGNFGYEYAPDEYFTAVASWYQQEHGVDVDPAWMQYVSGVIPALTACLNYFTAPGDGIVMLEPIYNSFFGAIEKTGRKVVASQ
ncbi:aminotransferase class I/II-fold pyridoxal phosphate-dependent enzyme [Limosilactobacillus fermentum]|nr:aminotransferase class I/II-fold pyridoxal phosphate-dependent enzyme [Limosilactobacillus fermentum]WJD85676.1 aminotransferase class I/II-fold pyridoxal phosphate-dependent enzyme [Limosilactobacillus fermentum]